MSKRKPYMHNHYLSMMRITPSADAEGRHSEGKKPYSRGKITYKQMEDLDFKDLARSGGGKNPCSGHKNLTGGFIPLSINCADGLQEVQFEVSTDFVSPVIVADEDGLSLPGGKPISSNTVESIGTGGTLMTFDPDAFSGDGIEIICIDVHDAECGGSSTFCMFLIGCDSNCDSCDCAGAEDCVAECCVTGGTEVAEGGTLQLTCPSGGSWSVTGTGVSIDQDGLLTATAGACGVAVVSNSHCQDIEIRVTGTNSDWVLASDDITGGGVCNASGSCGTNTSGECSEISGGTKITYTWAELCCCDDLSWVENPGLPSCATPVANCSAGPCGDGNCATYPNVSRTRTYYWECL